MGLASGYVAVVRHAATAESLVVRAFSDTGRPRAELQPGEASLADMFYNLDLSEHEYRCASQVLDDFQAAADSNVRQLATETREVFLAHATWVAEVRSDIKRRATGDSRTAIVEAERLANLHKRRDALAQMFGLNAGGLTQVLVEPQPGTKRLRLALTSTERDSIVAALRPIAAGSTDAAGVARIILLSWLSDKWATR